MAGSGLPNSEISVGMVLFFKNILISDSSQPVPAGFTLNSKFLALEMSSNRELESGPTGISVLHENNRTCWYFSSGIILVIQVEGHVNSYRG